MSIPISNTSTQLLKGLKTLCAFACGFVVTVAMIYLMPINRLRLYAEQRSEKLALLDRTNRVADTAAFGSSHIHYGFDPRVFDATLKCEPESSTRAVKSINLGVEGGSQTEQRVMAQAFLTSLHDAGTRPRIVLLELNAGVNFTPDHLYHPRAINIYDWRTVRFASSFATGLPARQRFGRTINAAIDGALYVCNVGIVSNALFGSQSNPEIYRANTDDDRRGLILDPPPVSAAIKLQIADAVSRLKQMFARPVNQAMVVHVRVGPGNRELIDDLALHYKRLFGSAELPQFVYIVAPLVSDRETLHIYPDTIATSVGNVPIINVARPDRYPELYDIKLWRDPAHLNLAGASVYSRLIAEELQRRWSQQTRTDGMGGLNAVR